MSTLADAVVAYRAAVDALVAADVEQAGHRELLDALDVVETAQRRVPVLQHAVLNRLDFEANPVDLGGMTLAKALAYRLRIGASDARRRIKDATQLGPRRAMTGESLVPHLEHIAAAQACGAIGEGHLRVLREFFTKLPSHVDAATRDVAERSLAHNASRFSPEQTAKVAATWMAVLHPDGDFTDAERRRERGITIGNQQADGMSRISGDLTPELRATIEALFAKLAARGMCNPDDDEPVVDGDPTADVADRDTRTPAQRNHDALLAMGRMVLCSNTLGRLNGLPVTVIVSTTLQELESAAGRAVTAGGSLLPMRDLIRMAAHAHHYLRVYDAHTSETLYLGRSKRCASAAQRIVLHGRDRGCTRPGCSVDGYHSQVHHAVTDWKDGGLTNVDDLAFACGTDNRLVENTGWVTRKRSDGRTEWIPPPEMDFGGPRVKDFHHPERLLGPPGVDDPG